MGGSKVQVNKAHKSRFASKSSRQAHKVPLPVKSRIAKPKKKSMKGARAARIQCSKMLRDQKRATSLKEKRASSGPSSSPRIIVLCGLSSSLNLNMLANELFILLSGEESEVISATVASQTYKLRTMFGRVGLKGKTGQSIVELAYRRAKSMKAGKGLRNASKRAKRPEKNLQRKDEMVELFQNEMSERKPRNARSHTGRTKPKSSFKSKSRKSNLQDLEKHKGVRSERFRARLGESFSCGAASPRQSPPFGAAVSSRQPRRAAERGPPDPSRGPLSLRAFLFTVTRMPFSGLAPDCLASSWSSVQDPLCSAALLHS